MKSAPSLWEHGGFRDGGEFRRRRPGPVKYRHGHTDMCHLCSGWSQLRHGRAYKRIDAHQAHPSVALEKKSGVAAVLALPGLHAGSVQASLGPGLAQPGTRVCVPAFLVGMRRTGSGQTWLAAKAMAMGLGVAGREERGASNACARKVEVRWAEERASSSPLSPVLPGCTRGT